jgi:hypothetical protein
VFDARWTQQTLTENANGAFSSSLFPSSVIGFEWNFGDGHIGRGVTARHDYAFPGEYNVSLSVTNTCGRRATKTHKVTVDAPHTYAPQVWLAPTEDYYPANTADFLDESKLQWYRSQPLKHSCEYQDLTKYGQVAPSELSGKIGYAYPHSASSGLGDLLPCGDESSLLFHSTDPALEVAAGKSGPVKCVGAACFGAGSGFLLNYKGSRHGAINKDRSVNVGKAPVYAEYASPGGDHGYVIYWFFYPYNHWEYKTPIGNFYELHEGDWEHIVVRLGDNDKRTEVGYAVHECGVKIVHPAFEASGGATIGGKTHPVVYSALGGHASYWSVPSNGKLRRTCGVTGVFKGGFYDFVGQGKPWKTWKNVRDARTEEWYGFNGAWGDQGFKPPGAVHCFCKFGPPGPSSDKLGGALPSGWYPTGR